MSPSTSEVQTEREVLLGRIRAWEKQVDEMSAENGRLVLNAQTLEDRKLVDHFENQFVICKNNLDRTKHHLKLHGADAGMAETLSDFETQIGKLEEEFVAFSESIM